MALTAVVFVYNADAKLTSAAFDFLHKIVSPSTYQCKLCGITYGNFSMVKEWKDFLAAMPVPVRLLRDEWIQETRRNDKLPAAFLQKENEITVWIPAEKMNLFELEDLMKFITEHISELS
jgi:hypothetical protein